MKIRLVLPGLLILCSPCRADELPVANRMCPVMTDCEGSEDYVTEYRGAEVRFCCSECQKEFRSHPEKYEDQLTLPAEPRFAAVRETFDTHRVSITSAVILIVLISLRIYRGRRAVTDADLQTWSGRAMFQSLPGGLAFGLATAFFGYQLFGQLDARYDARIVDGVHFATFHDFGYPPLPKHPDAPPRTSATFYRGNDERNEKLFNNGNYRTATFHVSLCDGNDQPIVAGTKVHDRQLFVKLEIVRPPFTPDFLYQEEMMNQMFLSQRCDAFLGRDGRVADRVDLTTTEPMQRWTARVAVTPQGGTTTDAVGVVYVCQEIDLPVWWVPWEYKARAGSRYHYGIQYQISVDNGVLTDESDIWMGALYRTRKFSSAALPLSEWFSHEPIPELPGSNVTDPELLGISDHAGK